MAPAPNCRPSSPATRATAVPGSCFRSCPDTILRAMADEEFHEIQLNGKQLVFLFMAGTVAAVVIFLCGLMVGRNLHVPRLEAAAAASETISGDPTRPVDAAVPPPAESNTGGPPVTIKETLSYSQLEDPTPVDEPLNDSSRSKTDKVTPP